MFLGNEEKVYILDKTEGNAAQIDGHPAWGAAWYVLSHSLHINSPLNFAHRDVNTHSAQVMEVLTNTFCASGMHLPNGSYATFGGNNAIGPLGSTGNVNAGAYDSTYGDYDGRKSIRILNPCTSADDMSSAQCQWFDNATALSMQKLRWYSAAEALGDGSIALIGGFVSGGYINRNYPNTDPEYEGGAAEPTYEFFPSKGPATVMNFMITTSGLNSYAHTYLMPSGNMLIQANISTGMSYFYALVHLSYASYQSSGILVPTLKHLFPTCQAVSLVFTLLLAPLPCYLSLPPITIPLLSSFVAALTCLTSIGVTIHTPTITPGPTLLPRTVSASLQNPQMALLLFMSQTMTCSRAVPWVSSSSFQMVPFWLSMVV